MKKHLFVYARSVLLTLSIARAALKIVDIP
jgi:hypothetical protein